MADSIPRWHLAGDWFDICSCNIPCPCEFAQPPTNNACQGLLVWHIRDGHYGELRLDGGQLCGVSDDSRRRRAAWLAKAARPAVSGLIHA